MAATDTAIKLNLGCGFQDWTEHGWSCLDPRAEQLGGGVRKWSFAEPIPFPAGTVDLVYTSHCFEFLDVSEYEPAAREIRRVLKIGGIWRVTDNDGGYFWQKIGRRIWSMRIKSEPNRELIETACVAAGFTFILSAPGETLSPHKDVLELGDNRHRRWRQKWKFYAECIK